MQQTQIDRIEKKLNELLRDAPPKPMRRPTNWYEQGQLQFPGESHEFYAAFSAYWDLWCAIDKLRELTGQPRDNFNERIYGWRTCGAA